jgi:3-hydroxybutyryl-CoA dehydrogenase
MWNDDTSEETKQSVLAFLRAQDHVPVITFREIKGFTLNRVWRAIKKECLKLWADGYTTPEDLDRAWMLEWGTPYGPFALMDKVGLDIVAQIERSYYSESQNEDDLPPKALLEMVENGFLGEKSGRGFYHYPNPIYAQEGWLRDELRS